MTSENDVLTDFLTIFHQKSGRGTTLLTPPPSASQHSNQFPVTGRVECGGGGFVVGPLSLSLSKWTLVAHRSGHVLETASLHSAVTHHTYSSLRKPGSLNLDLIGQPLLVSSEV
jgi:hypothetical protein